jgi:hypothetical protein
LLPASLAVFFSVASSSILHMVAANSRVTLITQRKMPEDGALHNHHHKNPISHMKHRLATSSKLKSPNS